MQAGAAGPTIHATPTETRHVRTPRTDRRRATPVDADEREMRLDLAACYRLVALYGWDDLVFTHISARLPGPEDHFLINPYGMLFDEITASQPGQGRPARATWSASRRTR